MNKLDELSRRICDHLGLDILEYKFEDLGIEDSRLYLKEEYIGINIKYKDNYIECAKCLTHEYRHVFQFYYVNLMNDNLSQLWKEEMAVMKTGTQSGYLGQSLELDAFAFTKYYLDKFENIKTTNCIEGYDEVVDAYINKYGYVL